MINSVSPMVQQTLVAIFVVFMMITVGIDLTVHKVSAIFRSPRMLTIGLVINYLVVPAIAFTFIHALNVEGMWAAGILFVAAAPGGPVGAVLTQKAHGDLALSVSMVVVFNLLNTILTPMLLMLLGAIPSLEGSEFPLMAMSRTIFLFQILPLALAMGFRHYQQDMALRIRPFLDKGSRILLGIVAIGILIMDGHRLLTMPITVELAIVGIVLCTMVLGRFTPGASRGEQVALSLTSVIRSIGIVLLLLAAWLPNVDALVSAMTYSGTMFLMAVGASFWFGRKG